MVGSRTARPTRGNPQTCHLQTFRCLPHLTTNPTPVCRSPSALFIPSDQTIEDTKQVFPFPTHAADSPLTQPLPSSRQTHHHHAPLPAPPPLSSIPPALPYSRPQHPPPTIMIIFLAFSAPCSLHSNGVRGKGYGVWRPGRILCLRLESLRRDYPLSVGDDADDSLGGREEGSAVWVD